METRTSPPALPPGYCISLPFTWPFPPLLLQCLCVIDDMIILKSLVAQGEHPSLDNKIQLLTSLPGLCVCSLKHEGEDKAADAVLAATLAAYLLGNSGARKEAAY